ncbi:MULTISPECIES: glycosyltransferase [Paenarthrobacter]|uniref:glycosyltransferase n=1 Tax=Paenarthrobacter TaxID=1742992 RepID=UPI0016641D59|nr:MULTISPECIES: glycosyltransferase [Paenarthrobacter]MBP2395572.1 glycosyltransferase involved in cell wall biosynthesis [Paenarthrobacter nicotinovorans]QOT22793.1 glycosyltransferase [Paenarthrobacter sp. YJN-D]UKE98309.1 glycosyltransferase [Paenarthrobacter nicotinovorans]UKF03096.1 glycosyltransferase [Paenarthrobacter nicotinovorans]
MAKILHVTECHYGGVSRAIRKLVDLTSEHQHYLLVDGQDQDFSAGVLEARRFQSSGTIGRTLEVRKAVAEFRPDYVHLHSSWAGAYGRLTRLRAKIIYQPHCYKFDDVTLEPAKKWLFRFAEKMLSFRSHATVVLSPHERTLTMQLNSNAECVYVPNAPSCDLLESLDGRDEVTNRVKRVVMVGRICKQKDPSFFGEIARLAASSSTLSDWEFRWIGDGEPDLRQSLASQGVQIAGWKESDELIAELDAGDYYVHTAAYEGFPISILDAAARGLPIVAREIDALAESGAYQVTTPEDVVAALEKSHLDPEFRAMLVEKSVHLLDAMNESSQEKAWHGLYSGHAGVAP